MYLVPFQAPLIKTFGSHFAQWQGSRLLTTLSSVPDGQSSVQTSIYANEEEELDAIRPD
jgi:hypothetical protein